MTTRPTFAQACAKFVNRYTAEHVPAWALKIQDGKYYAPHFATDKEWFENTKFYGEPGHFGRKTECYTSNQTWPFGQWLSAPFGQSLNIQPLVSVVEVTAYQVEDAANRIDVLHEKLRNLHTILNDDDADFDAWVSELAADPESAAHSAAVEYLKLSANEKRDTSYVAAAIEMYADDDCEFDDTPSVSQGNGGAFVQCWRWVPKSNAGIVDDYIAVEVDGQKFEFDGDSVVQEGDDGFEFWFYHGLAEPTVETVTPLIKKALGGEKV